MYIYKLVVNPTTIIFQTFNIDFMKQIFLLFFLLPHLNYAQVSGIGIFKIGKDKKNILDEIKKTTGVELTVFTDILEWANAKKSTEKTQLVSSLDSKKAYKGIDLPGVIFDSLRQDIDIDFYSVSNISLRNIGLVFYNDTLIRIRCNGSDSVFEALKAKYKEPKLTGLNTLVQAMDFSPRL